MAIISVWVKVKKLGRKPRWGSPNFLYLSNISASAFSIYSLRSYESDLYGIRNGFRDFYMGIPFKIKSK
jgi:hypothetical protein